MANGIMNPIQRNTDAKSILDEMKAKLNGNRTKDPEAVLQGMSEQERAVILNAVKMIDMMRQLSGQSAAEILADRFPHMPMERRAIFLVILGEDETQPSLDTSIADAAHDRLYQEYEEALPPLEQVLARRQTPLVDRNAQANLLREMNATARTTPRPRRPNSNSDDDLLNLRLALTAAESGGRSDAVYTLRDGSARYVGSLQIGQQRLTDFNRANGTDYTQDDILNDQSVQDSVNDWHMEDLTRQVDSYIESLGDRGRTVSRTGAIAAAHISGMGGLAKLVESNFEDNPTDELGGSALGYYQRFSRSN